MSKVREEEWKGCEIMTIHDHMGLSKNSGTPKWMVIMENPIKMI